MFIFTIYIIVSKLIQFSSSSVLGLPFFAYHIQSCYVAVVFLSLINSSFLSYCENCMRVKLKWHQNHSFKLNVRSKYINMCACLIVWLSLVQLKNSCLAMLLNTLGEKRCMPFCDYLFTLYNEKDRERKREIKEVYAVNLYKWLQSLFSRSIFCMVYARAVIWWWIIIEIGYSIELCDYLNTCITEHSRFNTNKTCTQTKNVK